MDKEKLLAEIKEAKEELNKIYNDCPNPLKDDLCKAVAVMLDILDSIENEIRKMIEEEEIQKLIEILE